MRYIWNLKQPHSPFPPRANQMLKLRKLWQAFVATDLSCWLGCFVCQRHWEPIAQTHAHRDTQTQSNWAETEPRVAINMSWLGRLQPRLGIRAICGRAHSKVSCGQVVPRVNLLNHTHTPTHTHTYTVYTHLQYVQHFRPWLRERLHWCWRL